MSGGLRSTLALAFPRQQKKIGEAKAYIAQNGNFTAARENLGIRLISKLKVSLNEYERVDSQWLEIISSIDDDDAKEKEQKIYQDHAFDDQRKNPFKEIIADLEEAIADIDAEVTIIQNTLATAAAAAALPAPVPPGPGPTITIPSQIVLLNQPGPETKKRLFSGDPAEYKGFMDDWDNSVGNRNDLSDVLKLQMLKQRVDGEAFTAISRFFAGTEYQEALDKLKQRFGREEEAKTILIKKLKAPVTDKNDLIALRKSFDDFEAHLACLGGYGEDMEALDFKLILQSKLPDEVLMKLKDYERSLPNAAATLTDYRKQTDLIISDMRNVYGRFLPKSYQPSKPAVIQKSVAFVSQNNQKQQRPQQGGQQVVKQEFKKVTTFTPKCSFCEGVHWSDECPSCTSLDEAKQIARDKKLCFKCFKPNHSSEHCRQIVKCHKCSQRHHTLYCRSNGSKQPAAIKKYGGKVVAANKVVAQQKGDTEVMLLSREVTVSHPEYPKRSQKVLVFVDSGAQLSLIDKALTKSLKLPVQEFSTQCQGPIGEEFVAEGKYQLNIHLQDGTKYPVQACGSSEMVQRFPIPTAPIEQFYGLTKEMKQPLPIKHGSPRILLSMKEFGDLVAHQPSGELGNGFFWISSKLGPLVGGEGSVLRLPSKQKSQVVATIGTTMKEVVSGTEQRVAAVEDESLELAVEKAHEAKSVPIVVEKDGKSHGHQLKKTVTLSCVQNFIEIDKRSVGGQTDETEKNGKKPIPVVAKVTAESITSNPSFLYDLELIGIKDDPNADENRLFQQRFLETVEQNEDGRITAELPFHDLSNLGTNLNNCFRRLSTQSKKFLRDPEYASLYKKAVDEFLENKFTEVVSNDVLNDADSHFMPHSLVITPGKTTSARLVFDGSCKTEKGESINDKLLTGDNRLPKLAGVLLRGRLDPIIVASDIKKAFLQVHLKSNSRKYVRFLFLKDVSKPLTRDNLVVYQFCVNPFGLNSSPNMLAHAIEFHLKKFSSEHPEFTQYLLQVLRNNYVDNLSMGSKLVEEAISSNEIVKQAFAAGQMDLRGHVSNNLEVNKHFGVEVKSFNFLGHELIIESDELVFGWKNLDPSKSPKTKRALLSFAASLFDLLGILEPLRVPIKLLIRRAWDHKTDWKSLMDSSLIKDVKVLFDERVHFSVRIKRHVFQNADPSSIQLHIFADASAQAYGCVAYIRYLDINNKYQTTLIYAKSRIAPVKPVMTITKLELTATALAQHAAEFLKAEFHDVLVIEKVIIHTDSTTVLYWIKNPEGKGRYVINRVNKLNASDAEFRHVQGTINPADLVSRGCSPAELVNNKLWFEGPEFLRKAEKFWPVQPNLDQEAEKLEPLIVATLKINNSKKVVIQQKVALVDATKFQTWQSLVETYAVIIKFLSKSSTKFSQAVFKVDKPDEIQILQKAEAVLVKQIQASVEITAQTFISLDLYVNKDVVKKYCKVKLENDPIYLADCPETRLLILNIHAKMNHGSVAMVLSQLNQRFYLPKARSIVKSTLRNRCMGCRKAKAVPFALPLMHDLPAFRNFGKPFEAVGIDLGGPFSVKLESVSQPKSHWVVVFTCLSTRAIHLECVPSLSGESFIEALTRMASKRGMPSFIFSDNATNLKVTAATVIPKWITAEDPDVMNYCTSRKIRWKFTTQKAPWAGGVYEAMIKLFKVNLKKAIGRKHLIFWKFLTLLSQVEAWVNCRPLTYISDDSNQIVIRPVDFLSPFIKPGLPSIEVHSQDPSFSLGSNHENLIALWTKSQEYLKRFKDGFNNDYLKMLRDRTRHHQQSGNVVYRNPRVDEVVLLFEEGVDKEVWKLARVVEVLQGADGRCRSATVKTPSGKILKRPVNHLLPLEVDDVSMSKLTQPMKATNLPELHLGDPLAFEHAKPPESSEELASIEDEPPVKAHPMRTRRDPRRVMSIFTINPAFVLVCCLLSLFTSVSTERCPDNSNLEKVYNSPCLSKEFLIYRLGSGYCWQEYTCTQAISFSKSQDKFCGLEENCNCPSWAHACSSGIYDKANIGNSTAKHAKIKQILTLQKPLYCSFKDNDPRCHHLAQNKDFIQVQLLDNTLHFVKEIHLIHQQIHDESFKCFGNGSDGYDGPPDFCNSQSEKCYADASSACVPTFIEKHFLQTQHGNVEIKAWGYVNRNVYLHKSPTTLDLKVSCDKGEIIIEGTQLQDVLQFDYLKQVEFVKASPKVTSFFTPKPFVGIDRNVTVTLWRKGVTFASDNCFCNKTDICTLINFGPEFIINNCINWWQYCIIILFLIMIPLCIIEILYIIRRQERGSRARLLKILFEKICYVKFLKLSTTDNKKLPENVPLVELNQITVLQKAEEMPSIPLSAFNSSTPMLRYKTSSVALCLTICIFLMSSVSGKHQIISFQAKNDYCIRNSEGIKSCQHNNIAYYTLMDSDNVEMLFEDNEQQPQASLSVTVKPTAICQKGFSKFSRLVDVKVYSSKRCPSSGSCIDDVCRTTSSNSLIPELSLVNAYPGVTQCTSSCGCWGCGCFLCSDSCTFFRFYAQPVDEIVYEQFSCRKWILGADIDITFRSQGINKTDKIYLEEGMVHELEHFKISLPSVRTSDVISYKNFIFDGKRIAFADDVSSKAMQILSCNSQPAASKLQCKLSEDTCKCVSAGEGVNCQCSQNHILKTQLDGSFLPSEKTHIQVIDNSVLYVLERATSDLIVETKHLDVVTIVDYNSCHLLHSSVQGCANCPSGAFIFLTCNSDFNKAFGVVQCGASLKFSLLCDNNIHIITTDFDHSDISLNCTLKCPANVEHFYLNGTLQFIDEPFISFNNTKFASNVSWYKATSTFIVNLLSSYKTVLIIIVILIVVILLK